MNEIILYYHIDDDLRDAIKIICDQLDIKTKEVKEKDVDQTMGYLLEIPGFDRQEAKNDKIPTDSMLFFAGMSMEQLNILLDVFQSADLPYIPLKAMLTENNINYPFYVLHENVNKEYLSLKNNGIKKEI